MSKKYYDYINQTRESNFDDRRYINENLKYEYYQNKQKRKLIGYIFIGLGIITYIALKFFIEIQNIYSTLSGLILITGGLVILLLNYLQSDTAIFINGENISNNTNNILILELEELKLEFQKFRKKAGILDDDQNIDKTINNIIDRTFNKEFIQDKIEKTFSQNAVKSSRLDNLINEFEKTSYRINDELNRLRKSANLNLVIGSLSTTIAIVALTYEVFFSEIDFKETIGLLSHYIPRLSLVVFIEIFAFFFLKLYKSNLLEIKYFNNEKTNIDFKLITLKTALFQEDTEMIKLCLTELIKTERNFILKKDETTVEIEKFKSDKNDNQIIANLIGKVISNK